MDERCAEQYHHGWTAGNGKGQQRHQRWSDHGIVGRFRGDDALRIGEIAAEMLSLGIPLLKDGEPDRILVPATLLERGSVASTLAMVDE